MAKIEVFENKYKHELEGMCPRYVPEMGFKSGEGLEWCVAGHAERNAIYAAAREGIRLEGSTIFTPGLPCPDCARAIIQAGIVEIPESA